MGLEAYDFHGRIKRFQSEQKFVFLFWALLLLLLVSPLLQETALRQEISAAIQTLVFFAIIYVHLDSKTLFISVIALVAVALASLWWQTTFYSPTAALVQSVVGATLCFFLDVTILKTITWESSVNRNVVFGAISSYLLFGFGCGYLFGAIDLIHPGSFSQISPFQYGKFSATPYWQVSFLSLTTLGYMDVAPAWGLTKSLAVVEAILGQLFLVVVVAMLVGLRTAELIRKRQALK
jgi:voltage-gated potassium channel